MGFQKGHKINLGKIYTDEHKRKIGLGNKGKKYSEETKKRMSINGIGRHWKLSDDTKRKLSLLRKERWKGKIMSEEQKRKISIGNKGKSRGKGRIFTIEHRKNMSKSHIGLNNWTKGRHHSKKAKEKISIANKGRKLSEETKLKLKGRIVSEETRKKLSKSHKGWIPPKSWYQKRVGQKRNEITKERMKNSSLKGWKEGRHYLSKKSSNTSIEVKIQNFLKDLNIEFFTHQYLHIEHDYQVDIFIPSLNLIIECYGNYWHKYPVGREIDNLRCKELREKGYKLLVLWESEVKVMNVDDLNYKILNYII